MRNFIYSIILFLLFYRVGPAPSKTPEISSPGSPNQRLSLTPQSPVPPQTPRIYSPTTQQQGFNPFIYGNDVDSVDVATRVAMVCESNKINLHILNNNTKLFLY